MRHQRPAHRAYVICLLLCIGAYPVAGSEQDQRLPRIGATAAMALASEVANAHGPVTLTENQRAFDPDFYYFAATWPNPTGSPVAGHYAVNPWTGDVWDADGCKRLESPSLKKLQDVVRRKSGLGRSVYSKLRAKRPLCIERGQQ
jgi:hypothetical protein